MLDGRVLGASQVEYKPFGKRPLKREPLSIRLLRPSTRRRRCLFLRSRSHGTKFRQELALRARPCEAALRCVLQGGRWAIGAAARQEGACPRGGLFQKPCLHARKAAEEVTSLSSCGGSPSSGLLLALRMHKVVLAQNVKLITQLRLPGMSKP